MLLFVWIARVYGSVFFWVTNAVPQRQRLDPRVAHRGPPGALPRILAKTIGLHYRYFAAERTESRQQKRARGRHAMANASTEARAYGTAPRSCNPSGERPINAPVLVTYLGLQQERHVSWGAIYARVDWSWTDEYHTSFSAILG
jgi:hypothetical protein